jgi:hypothetical protein
VLRHNLENNKQRLTPKKKETGDTLNKKKEYLNTDIMHIPPLFFFFYTHIGKPKSNKPNYKLEITGSIPPARVRTVEVE